MRVVTCPHCGTVIRDNPFWRGSKFDFNAEYMEYYQEAGSSLELVEVCKALVEAENFVPFVVGPNTFYRRGKGGKWLYRVPNEDFRVETEKRKVPGKQTRLPVRVRVTKTMSSEATER